jgi:DNA-binding Xre family transcriptional regulator
VKSKKNPHIGSNFDDFLREESIFEEVEAAALKKVIATALARQMKRRKISVSRLAAVLGTSRAAVNRVLDDRNTSITLTTLSRAASALGCKVKLEIEAA